MVLPSALNKASFLANILNTLFSQNVNKSVSLVCSFCIEPFTGFKSFVIGSACINWLVLLIPLVELYIPENIKPLPFLSSLYCSAKGAEALTPLSIWTALKSSLILLDSTPLPNE